MKTILMALVLMICLSSCEEKAPKPKPRGYPRVEYPEKVYTSFDSTACPFTFRYPGYADLEAKEESCWFNIVLPQFSARVHCSYVPIKSRAEFDDLVRDAFIIATKINERANYMEESVIRNKNGVHGLQLAWSGPAASPVHFFMTDTTQHFFKASLYFETKVQPDSLAPIIDFVREDIDTLIQSFRWK